MRRWSHESTSVLQGLFDLAFDGVECKLGLPPHVLDLQEESGEILPHVDSVKHGGSVVACLSLLSTRRLLLTEPEGDYVVDANSSTPPGTVL